MLRLEQAHGAQLGLGYEDEPTAWLDLGLTSGSVRSLTVLQSTEQLARNRFTHFLAFAAF